MTIDLLPGKAQFSLWSLLKSLVVVTGFVLVCSLIARAIEQRVMKLSSVALSTRVGITKFSHFFLVSLGVLLGINAAGVDMTALTLLTGAVGIGLGFGLQAITSNFVSGFVLLLDKSIKPGDVISFTGLTGTSTENFGWVQELRGRCVVVRDRDGVETLVPNQNLITSTVINWSYSDRKVRLKLPVRISYRDDPELALQLLLHAVEGNPRVLQEPAPVPRLMQFSDHGMDLELRFWIADPQNGVNNVRSEVNRAHLAPVPRRRASRSRSRSTKCAWSGRARRAVSGAAARSRTTDISISFVRGAGPGGQNVNKVATAAQLRFDLAGTTALDERTKARLRALAGHRLIGDAEILIVARNHRTQEGNRREALERLAGADRRARSQVPKTRRATRPTRASKERRIAGKLRRQRNKQLRGAVRHDD